MTEKLLLCPFCGGEPRMDMDKPFNTPRWVVSCTKCGGEGGPGRTAAEARNFWENCTGPSRVDRECERLRAELAEVNAAAYQMQIAIACYLHLQVARGGAGRISVHKHDLAELPDALKGELETWSDHDEIVLRLKPAEASKAVKS